MIDRIRAWLVRTAETLREKLYGGAPAGRGDEALDFWLNGHTLARAVALRYPGIHGAEMVAQQKALEQRARVWAVDLERRLVEAERENARLRRAIARAS